MKFRLPIIILAAAVSAGFVSCNSNDDSVIEIIEDSSVANVEVTSFLLQKNSNGVNYDSLFFSIDLANAVIFNADSLPVGTPVGKMLVDVELPTVKKAEFVMKYADKEDEVVDYTENSSDSIDFAADRVVLRVVSYNEKVMREYQIKINVHQLKPDSLYWDKTAFSALPGAATAPSAQKTVEMNGKFYTLVKNGASAILSETANIGSMAWTSAPVAIPAGARIETFSAAGSTFYILDSSDNLYKSSDARTWSAAGSTMSHIYGAYGSALVGVRKNAGKYYHVSYPESGAIEVSKGCPVSGTSAVMAYDSKWSDNEMITFTGGRDADGTLSGATWGFDGTKWVKLSVDGMPAKEGISVCEYYTASVNNFFSASTSKALYAFGGRKADGSVDNTLYISVDRGVHWTKATYQFQFPTYAPELYSAQAFVCNTTKSVTAPAASRAVKPITSWDCPYLYVMGGYEADGTFNRSIFRAVINQLSFVPLQ